jgi:hypothetical protein
MTRSRKSRLRIPEPSPRFFTWAVGLGIGCIFLVVLIQMAWRGHA